MACSENGAKATYFGFQITEHERRCAMQLRLTVPRGYRVRIRILSDGTAEVTLEPVLV